MTVRQFIKEEQGEGVTEGGVPLLTQVENFTVSFSDGRALCCLLHHYHPALLPLDRIHFHTSQSLQEAAERAEEGAADSEDELSQDWGAGPFGGLCSIVCVCGVRM